LSNAQPQFFPTVHDDPIGHEETRQCAGDMRQDDVLAAVLVGALLAVIQVVDQERDLLLTGGGHVRRGEGPGQGPARIQGAQAEGDHGRDLEVARGEVGHPEHGQ